MKVTEDMTVFEVLTKYPEVEEVFIKNGLACVGCPGAEIENLREASQGHNVDCDKLLVEINEFLGK